MLIDGKPVAATATASTARAPARPPLRATTRLRALLAGGHTVFVPGCFNAVSARVIEMTGFPAVYMTGYGTSVAQLGMPDVGFATMTEMHTNARWIANAVSIPVIADADNGYGNAVNVTRTVREYIQTGVAGIHLEDQSLPKRCGHVAGRQVISLTEAVGKIRAADAVRRQTDPDFVLIARTDARGAVGGSLDDAIARVNAYLDAGADMGFVEGPTSVAEVERICREVKGPVFYNMTGVSPRFTIEQMNELGIVMTITANTMLRAALTAMYDVALAMRDEGPMVEAALMERIAGHPVGDLHKFSGLDGIRKLEEAYMPAEELAKYDGTIGYRPQT